MSELAEIPKNDELWAVTPEDIQQAINLIYDRIKSGYADQAEYTYKGAEDYWYRPPAVSAHAIGIELAETEDTDEPFTMLDLGGGNGSFAHAFSKAELANGRKIEAASSDGSGFLHNLALKDQIRQLTFEMHEMHEHTDQGEFDFITSHLALTHVVDSLSVVAQAYRALKPGGVFVTDPFWIKGTTTAEGLAAYWKDRGVHLYTEVLEPREIYKIHATVPMTGFGFLALRKPHDGPELLPMPVAHNGLAVGSTLKGLYPDTPLDTYRAIYEFTDSSLEELRLNPFEQDETREILAGAKQRQPHQDRRSEGDWL